MVGSLVQCVVHDATTRGASSSASSMPDSGISASYLLPTVGSVPAGTVENAGDLPNWPGLESLGLAGSYGAAGLGTQQDHEW